MRTEALFALITVILRAATLVFQSLLIGGIVFHRWIAASADPPFLSLGARWKGGPFRAALWRGTKLGFSYWQSRISLRNATTEAKARGILIALAGPKEPLFHPGGMLLLWDRFKPSMPGENARHSGMPTSGVPRTPVPHLSVPTPVVLVAPTAPGIGLLRGAAIALAVSQALFLGVNTLLLRLTLGLRLAETIGAHFFLVGLVTIGAAVAVAATPTRRLARPGNLVIFLSLVVLACGVLASHAASRLDHRAFLIACTLVHQGAAALWIGGLPQLWFSLRGADSEVHAGAARRFSRLALVGVVALFGSGLAMALRYIDSPSALYGTSYGVMVAVKTLFFMVLISIGALNRKLVQSFSLNSSLRPRILLRHMLEAEIGIGITAILAAASLTSQPPAADLKLGRVTSAEIYERMRPSWPRLSSSRLNEISRSSLQDTKLARRAGLPPPPNPPNTSADIAWSEYNHHWAGIFVLLLGVLAALAQRRRPRIARYWPLLLAGLAVFIFLRADPEGWPLGPDSFWEAIQNSEVLQHKAFALLLLLFAGSELRVQLGKKRSFGAFVFPAVCALGGAVLLTHSHGLGNVKEQLLAELSHAPIAVAAVFAGWSRWLELRLPGAQGRWMTRVWPVCFVVIGAILLNYREA